MPCTKPLAVSAQAENAGNRPYRVLFVCTGNTCRSPMAEALFRDRMLRWRGEGAVLVASAGLYAAVGAPISPNAVLALEAFGIADMPANPYRAHQARNVDAQLMAEADEVVAISAGHAMELLMRYPAHASKITALPLDIPDPYGGDEHCYRACLECISCAIQMKWPDEESLL